MRVSLNPTYLCNFRCEFCYLGEKLSNTKLITPEELESSLNEISRYKAITGVDIYGGEIGVVPEQKFEELLAVIRKFFIGKIQVTTNLSRTVPFLLKDEFDLYVSYDGSAREKHELVLKNMQKLERDFHVLMLSTPKLISQNADEFIRVFNSIDRIQTVEIKPYSTNQYNQLEVSFAEQEEWVRSWIESSVPKKFDFVNELNIQESLARVYNSYSDDHIYVTPSGKLSVLDFDDEDREYFRELEGMHEYIHWCFEEKERSSNNSYCGSCHYQGHCLTEHIRDVKSVDHSCNGGVKILDWYAGRIQSEVAYVRP